MPHNQQTVFRFQKFSQRMCLYPGLHAGRLFQLLGFAAVILDLFSILDDSLIAAASKGHINGCPGKFVILNIGFPIHSDADT